MGGCASVQQPSDVRDRERDRDPSQRPVRAPIQVKAAQVKPTHTQPEEEREDEDEGEGAGTRNNAASASPIIPEVTLTAASGAEDTAIVASALSPEATPATSNSSSGSGSGSVALVSESSPSSSPLAVSVAAVPERPLLFGTEPLPPAAFLALLSPAALKARGAHTLPAGSKVARMWGEILRVGPAVYAREHPQHWGEILTKELIPSALRSELWSRGLRVEEMDFPVSYSQLLASPCKCDDQISRDTPRTFSDHSFFSGRAVQQALGRILHATALCTPRIGYVQGLNYLAAMMLWISCDEEASWRMMVTMLSHPARGTQHLYGEGLHALIAQCTHFDRTLLPLYSPVLAAHLKARGVEALMYATPLYLTLLTHHLPLEDCKHVWDFCLLAAVGEATVDQVEGEEKEGEEGKVQQADAGGAAASPISTAAASVAASSPSAAASPFAAASPSAAARGNSVTPVPSAPPPPLSLLPCPLSHSVTLLTLSLLDVSSSRLLRLTSMEKLFHAIQRLDPLAKEKSRRRIFKAALHREQQRRKQTQLAKDAQRPEG